MAEPGHRRDPSRRVFLAAGVLAAGTVVAVFRLGRSGARTTRRWPRPGEVGYWVVLHRDGTATIRVPQMEMGQGAVTSTAQLLAEELELDWSSVRTEFISFHTQLTSKRPYGRTETDSSLGVSLSARQLRLAGAQLRLLLLDAGAERLGVSAAELVATAGTVAHPPTGRSLTYAELAPAAARGLPRPVSTITLKPPEDWKLIGRSPPRLDIPDKVRGRAVFGGDLRLPGMKFAAIEMSPAFGGRLVRFDPARAARRPGVVAVLRLEPERWGAEGTTDEATAVVADTWWQARAALPDVLAEWERPSIAAVDSPGERENLLAGLEGPPVAILREEGDPDPILARAPVRHEAVYFLPFLEHAALETPNFTALVERNRFELWGPTQDPEAAMHLASNITGLPVSAGELHPTLIGGAFGRLQFTDCVAQAVRIAMQLRGTPVQVLWSREDTVRHGYYRPAGVSRLRAGLDRQGRLLAWSHRVVAHSDGSALSTAGSAELPYAIPNQRVELALRSTRVPEGPMRGVAFTHNCFVAQCFVDELARTVGRDTAEFQRTLLTGPRGRRLQRLLDEAVRLADWRRPLDPPRGRGMALLEEAGSAFVVVAEVTLTGNGWLSVDRVVVVGDPGILLHPGNASAQVEGSVVFGLTSLLHGRITLKGGAVVESNFHDYRLLRMRELPKIECHWLPDGSDWGGIGEPVVSAVPPAVANAIVAAGGPRIRSLPVEGQIPRHPKPGRG